MIFEEYLNQLNEIAQSQPKSLKFKVVTSADDEGNNFNEVVYLPSLGLFDKSEFESNTSNPNSICVN